MKLHTADGVDYFSRARQDYFSRAAQLRESVVSQGAATPDASSLLRQEPGLLGGAAAAQAG
jgi:hypothetical protein